MRALMYLGVGELEMRDVPPPDGEFVVKVAGCGICGTDLKTYKNGHHLFPPPAILGHEFYGSVSRAPSGSGYREGDLVVVAPYGECGACEVCERGAGALCRGKGYVDGGAFCEYVGIPADYAATGLFRIPEADDVFALVEPLACVLNGIEHLRLRPSSRALVVGGGPMGALFALCFKARGVPVAVAEPARQRRERIASWGVETCEPDAADAGKYDNVVVAVNKAELFDGYLRGVADAGTVLMFSGLPKGETIQVDSHSIHYREVALVGSYGYALPHFKAALGMIGKDRGLFSKVITHRLPLEEGRRGFDLLASGDALKVVLKP
jgi:L-iditol 2-dehydrogenase